jgi:hypothetical protein
MPQAVSSPLRPLNSAAQDAASSYHQRALESLLQLALTGRPYASDDWRLSERRHDYRRSELYIDLFAGSANEGAVPDALQRVGSCGRTSGCRRKSGTLGFLSPRPQMSCSSTEHSPNRASGRAIRPAIIPGYLQLAPILKRRPRRGTVTRRCLAGHLSADESPAAVTATDASPRLRMSLSIQTATLRRALAPHFDAEHRRGPVDGECPVCAFFGDSWPSVGLGRRFFFLMNSAAGRRVRHRRSMDRAGNCAADNNLIRHNSYPR